jgi:hypothetical protein
MFVETRLDSAEFFYASPVQRTSRRPIRIERGHHRFASGRVDPAFGEWTGITVSSRRRRHCPTGRASPSLDYTLSPMSGGFAMTIATAGTRSGQVTKPTTLIAAFNEIDVKRSSDVTRFRTCCADPRASK